MAAALSCDIYDFLVDVVPRNIAEEDEQVCANEISIALHHLLTDCCFRAQPMWERHHDLAWGGYCQHLLDHPASIVLSVSGLLFPLI